MMSRALARGQVERGHEGRAGVVVVDGAEAGGLGEGGLDLFAVAHDFPEGLGHGANEKKGLAGGGVPAVGEAGHVVGLHVTAAALGGAAAGKGLGGVEGAVVVGELLAGGDVADGELEVVADGEAVGGAGVVEEAPVVPAEDVAPLSIHVGIDFQLAPGVGRQGGDLLGGELLIEGVEGPDDGAFGNRAGGEDAPADERVDEPEFGMRVDHIGSCGGFRASRRQAGIKAGAERGL